MIASVASHYWVDLTAHRLTRPQQLRRFPIGALSTSLNSTSSMRTNEVWCCCERTRFGAVCGGTRAEPAGGGRIRAGSRPIIVVLTARHNGPLTTSDKVLGAHDAPADIGNRKMDRHIEEDDSRCLMKLRMIVNAAGELVPSLAVEMSRVYNATVSSLKPTVNKYCGRLSFGTPFPDPPRPLFFFILQSHIIRYSHCTG